MNINASFSNSESISAFNQSRPNHIGISSAKFIAEMTVHSVIFVLGTVGNILVAIVVCRNKSAKCTTNWLILNLAFSDLGITIFNIPMSNIYHFTTWPFGKTLCKYFLGGFGESIVGVSVFTHSSMALLRYHVVSNPMKCTIQLKHVKMAIAAIWLLAYASLSAPLTGMFDLVYSPMVKGYVCKPSWPSFTYRISYRSCVILLTYNIPMLTGAYCYIKIHSALKRSMNFFINGSASNVKQLMRREYKSRRLTRALFILFSLFTLTTLPLEIFYLLNDLRILPSGPYLAHIWSLLVALFYSLSVVNPMMLFYISEEYRSQLYNLFHLCSRRRCEKNQGEAMTSVKQSKSENFNMHQYTAISPFNGDLGEGSKALKRGNPDDVVETCLIKNDISMKERTKDFRN